MIENSSEDESMISESK